jgi:hypothetical protein
MKRSATSDDASRPRFRAVSLIGTLLVHRHNAGLQRRRALAGLMLPRTCAPAVRCKPQLCRSSTLLQHFHVEELPIVANVNEKRVSA